MAFRAIVAILLRARLRVRAVLTQRTVSASVTAYRFLVLAPNAKGTGSAVGSFKARHALTVRDCSTRRIRRRETGTVRAAAGTASAVCGRSTVLALRTAAYVFVHSSIAWCAMHTKSAGRTRFTCTLFR